VKNNRGSGKKCWSITGICAIIDSMTNRGHIPELDGVRAIAVLMVLSAHWPIYSQRFGYPLGSLGVSIFFTLSGFLITRILLFNRENGISIRQFWILRAARIFPLSLTILLGIGLAMGFDTRWWQCLTFTFNLLRSPTDLRNPALGPYWSLCIEEQFYLIWPLIVMFGGVQMARRAASSLITVGAIFLLALPVITVFYPEESDIIGWAGYFHTVARVPAIAVGCLLAIHEKAIRQSARSVVLVGIAALAVALSIDHILIQAASLAVDPAVAFPTMTVAKSSATTIYDTGVGFAVNLAAILLAFHAPSMGGVLRLAPLQWLGRVSFCVYLIHRPIWLWLGALDEGATTMLAAVGLLAVFIVAELSRRFFEQPIRDWARTLTRQPPPRPHAEHEHAQQHARDGQAAGVAP
jgi:peptidoglycan/LPS O-acetylase OafA/YrhL